MREGARGRRQLGEAPVAVVGLDGPQVTVIAQRDEGADRRPLVPLIAVDHRAMIPAGVPPADAARPSRRVRPRRLR